MCRVSSSYMNIPNENMSTWLEYTCGEGGRESGLGGSSVTEKEGGRAGGWLCSVQEHYLEFTQQEQCWGVVYRNF